MTQRIPWGPPSPLAPGAAWLLSAALLGGILACSGTGPGQPGSAAPPAAQTVQGTVTTLDGDGRLTLALPGGATRTVRIDAATRVNPLPVRGHATPQALREGLKAHVTGTLDADGAFLARRVFYAAAPFGAKRPGPGLAEPAARIYHDSAYRPASDEMFIFGGQSAPSWTFDVYDMWSCKVSTGHWRHLGEQPVHNYDGVAYDASADRIILYNPFDAEGSGLAVPETWAFDPRTGAWENRQAANTPSARWGTHMVYDVRAGKTVLFGGGSLATWLPLDETWTYDYAANAWSRLETPSAPPALNYGAMTYDPLAGRVVLFSGNCWDDLGNTWNTDQTWVLDVGRAAWRQVAAGQGPSARNYHRLVCDPRLGLILMFGGCTGTDMPDDPLIPQNDTWVFHTFSGTWWRLETEGTPSPRGWHTMEFSERAGVAVVFGGGSSREAATNEAWTFQPFTRTWRPMGF